MATTTADQKGQGLYPPIESYDTGRLAVSGVHTLYFEQCANPDGNPVLFLHGGPGSGFSPRDRCFFDPKIYRIILFDQRGAGKSTPAAELKENTTWDLVADIEKLRTHLSVEKWVVFGGSWGSTLALVYAETHPVRVKALILRGIYLGIKAENDWMYKAGGASNVFPDVWEQFVDIVPEAERSSLIDAYYRRLTSEDKDVFLKFARMWNKMELVTCKLFPDEKLLLKADEDDVWALQHARIECHYFLHGLFLDTDNWILDHVDKLREIPATIVHGRYDMTCPMSSAWALHKRWPEAKLEIVAGEGHSNKEVGIMKKLIEATDKYKHL